MSGIASFTTRLLKGVFGTPDDRLLGALQPILRKINALEPEMRAKSDEDLRGTAARMRERFAAGESLDEMHAEVFAAVREAGRRILGMRHYDVQMIGASILHQGNIAEMVTGEGKTLVATPAVVLNAIPAKGVHVVTVNDYLAKRDRDWMAPVYEALGLTVGVIQHDMDNAERKVQYGCDITYGTNNEFGFDYLRDNMKVSLEEQVQRGFHYAVVDEVDSILIDEARTPLIIAGSSEEATDKYYEADRVVQGLIRKPDGLPPDVDDDAGDWHFIIKEKEHQAILTEKGLEECERRLGIEDIYGTASAGGHIDWPHHLTQALRARHLYQRDKEYVVQEGEVIIVDDFTGRMMPGRRWSDGLHQAVEAKEGLQIQAENQTLATITLQNYFKLYEKLSGMTGTAKTEEGEFDKIYKLGVVVIPTNRPLIRLSMPDVVYMSEKEKFDAIVNELARYHASGRPLLVGTASIERSEVCSALLQRRGVPHQVLNAKQHEREAQIVAKAGELGAVTIATNMAGRGTDIVLGTFEREELLAHWRENGLAPYKLKSDDPECAEKLVRHWAGIFLPEKKRDGTPEELRERLIKEWKSTNHPILALGTHVQALGGLHILGTERHDSRRIDNQLRGRSGRQGDPGSSQFFLSLEDSLMRRFAGPKVQALLRKLGMREGDDITSPMVTRQIEKAQAKVELHNFEIRKNLLEYDEVMNEQRKTIYSTTWPQRPRRPT
jgi:preprotein translocase subunit SecA